MKKILVIFTIIAIATAIGVDAKTKAERDAAKEAKAQAKIEKQQAKAEAKADKVEAKAAKAQTRYQKRQAKEQARLAKSRARNQQEAIKAQAKLERDYAKFVAKGKKKDVLNDVEYKVLKQQYFAAEGYGHTYNCKVEQQKFCKVKDFGKDGVYILCDRDVSRTQWESTKLYYKYGRCIQLN